MLFPLVPLFGQMQEYALFHTVTAILGAATFVTGAIIERLLGNRTTFTTKMLFWMWIGVGILYLVGGLYALALQILVIVAIVIWLNLTK